MVSDNLQHKFARMGARVRIERSGRLSVDVRRDREGEFFAIGVPDRGGAFVNAQDIRPKERHLLLVAREEPEASMHRFLCGHDERAWFVAAVPGVNVTSVRAAKEALKPPAVRFAQEAQRVRRKDRNRRRNEAFVRQGEWFFLPDPRVRAPDWMVLHKEPIQRTGGKPHMAEWAFRGGGEVVYVDPGGRTVLSATQFAKLRTRSPERARNFVQRVRNAGMWVKGRISHPDHKTIVLHGWHQVVMNAEHQAPSMRFVQFID